MRNFLIAAATVVGAAAVAAPVSAQYYPQPRGNAYGYDNYGQVRNYQVRVHNLRRTIDRMGRQGARGGHFFQLRQEVGELEYQFKTWSRNGLNHREARELDWRIARVEQMMPRGAVRNRAYNGYNSYNGYNGYNAQGGYPQYNGYNGYVPDRARDGRDDRYENDRGWDDDDD
jgi:hypothetical protein